MNQVLQLASGSSNTDAAMTDMVRWTGVDGEKTQLSVSGGNGMALILVDTL